MVGLAPRHYTGFPGAQLEHMNFEFWGNCSALGAVLGTGGQASQIRSESAQTLRRHTDIALVQLPAHIAITQPCTPSITQVSSSIANTQLRTSSIAIAQPCTPSIPNTQRVSSNIASMQRYCSSTAACTHRKSKHRKYTASQLKCYEYKATYIKHRKYTEVHAKHPKYTASQLKDCACTAILL